MQAKRDKKEIPKRGNPPTTQAGTAIARSSRPPCCKQSTEEQGRQKLDNQIRRAVPS
ncbi:hypothetical protein GYMLUDRAFT_42211 [Collybiopsis luxurians FD-317 M1]|uniref:Uncharacterized protein n=1 Tax=Collybiopsis luxurians FD-317 M1 TaxID=944289 RepID=A0A0D0CSG5_9AGAR|nr:hypothetical protein GYMLUDRAFT_42211 [Collybiopsis luxurians FD-317 M1]